MNPSKSAALLSTLGLAAGLLVATAPASSAAVTSHHGSGRPALALTNTRLYVAWAGTSGTASARELDLGWSTDNGATLTRVATGATTPQDEGPALATDGTNTYLAWEGVDGGHTVNVAVVGASGLTCTTAVAATTIHAPALAIDATGRLFLSWVGWDSHLNVAPVDTTGCATTHTMTLGTKTILNETSTAAPAIALDITSANEGLVLAFDDAAGHLHVGVYNGTATLGTETTYAWSAPLTSANAPGLGTSSSDLYLCWRGSDGTFYISYAEGSGVSGFNTPVVPGGLASGLAPTSGLAITNTNLTLYAWFDATGALNISQ